MGLEYKNKALMKLNLKFFLDVHLIREAAFTNVPSGSVFYDGSDMSMLLPDTSADDYYFGLSNGQVWQSPFRNWVYESGVPIDGMNVPSPPIVASGLLIEGNFRGTGDPEFGHTIDYINGRVIFDTPQSSDLKVNAAFAYKDVRVDFEHAFNQQFKDGFIESKYTTNPLTSYQVVYPSGNAQPFPAVFIEVDDRELAGYEMGNRSAIITDTVNLWVWALDDMTRDNIVDIITAQWHKVLYMIDFNKAPLPLSGIFNTLSPEYIPYQDLLKNTPLPTVLGGGTPIRYISHIDDVTSENLPFAEEYERAKIVFKMKTYLNAPTTPLGHRFEAIQQLPPLGDIGL
jgi:hypothetical protein